MRDLARIVQTTRAADRRMPLGSKVRYWPGARWGPGRIGRTLTRFGVTSSGEVVCLVDTYPGWISATHIEPEP